MTLLLERAFVEVSKLPESEQDSFASLLLAELDSGRKWSEAFASTQDKLAMLADRALREFESGETLQLDTQATMLSAFVDAIEKRREKLGLSYQDIADRTALSRQAVHSLLKGNRKNTTIRMIALLCASMDIAPYLMFDM